MRWHAVVIGSNPWTAGSRKAGSGGHIGPEDLVGGKTVEAPHDETSRRGTTSVRGPDVLRPAHLRSFTRAAPEEASEDVVYLEPVLTQNAVRLRDLASRLLEERPRITPRSAGS